MATSPPRNTTTTNAPALPVEREQITTSPDGALPAATADSADVPQTPVAAANQDQGNVEAALNPIGAGPPTTMEADPAPIQPPIQPVSILAMRPYLPKSLHSKILSPERQC